jgi:hypothetical protein
MYMMYNRYGLMWKESANGLPKVVGFLRVLRFPSRKSWVFSGFSRWGRI